MEAARERVLVAGASGFVGRRLCPALVEAGYDVAAMTRRPSTYHGAGEAVFGDVHDPATLDEALTGCRSAYYLVHSLASKDFERLDASAARAFGEAAARAGVERIVYLGGLGRDADQLSAHLRSRREVEQLLGVAGVPVTTLRAGIVIGHGGLSWEMTRQLVERLPLMVTPRWVSTRTQPIALDDVVRYLVSVLSVSETTGRAFEVGGDEVLRYSDMMRRVAAIDGRSLSILPVPLLSPQLSSRWLALVTDVDTAAGRSIVDSMVNEVVVDDDELHRLIPFQRKGFDDAVRAALAERTSDASAVARRRKVVIGTSVVGAGLLGLGLSAEPGSRRFYATTLATAAVNAFGGLASGPIARGELVEERFQRMVMGPIATGVGAFGVFYAGAHVARRVPVLSRYVTSALQYAERGDQRLVLATALANGAAEEIFFRGAVFSVLADRRPVLTTTGVYALATVPTRNPVLVAAATAMGVVWGFERSHSGGVQAPMLTHVTWSALMLRFLPPLFRQPPVEQRP
jgi:uncharacterized protein YbjT (DUF2867 family)/membrane protease YdiL (CAAX protease family)